LEILKITGGDLTMLRTKIKAWTVSVFTGLLLLASSCGNDEVDTASASSEQLSSYIECDGYLSSGNDMAPDIYDGHSMSLEDARFLCDKVSSCGGFTRNSRTTDRAPTYFKTLSSVIRDDYSCHDSATWATYFKPDIYDITPGYKLRNFQPSNKLLRDEIDEMIADKPWYPLHPYYFSLTQEVDDKIIKIIPLDAYVILDYGSRYYTLSHQIIDGVNKLVTVGTGFNFSTFKESIGSNDTELTLGREYYVLYSTIKSWM